MAIAGTSRGYHTGSSQYASAQSESKLDDSIRIQRMSLGPIEATHFLDHAKIMKTEPL